MVGRITTPLLSLLSFLEQYSYDGFVVGATVVCIFLASCSRRRTHASLQHMVTSTGTGTAKIATVLTIRYLLL